MGNTFNLMIWFSKYNDVQSISLINFIIHVIINYLYKSIDNKYIN